LYLVFMRYVALPIHLVSILTSQVGAKYDITPVHRKSFQQLWLGLWWKYAEAPHVATSNRKDKRAVDVACKALLSLIDSTMTLRPRRLVFIPREPATPQARHPQKHARLHPNRADIVDK
jgi:hypothetical protein